MSKREKEPRLPPTTVKKFASFLVGNPEKPLETSLEARTNMPNRETYMNIRKNMILEIGYGCKVAGKIKDMDCKMLLSYKGIRAEQAVSVLIGARMPKESFAKMGVGIASEQEET